MADSEYRAERAQEAASGAARRVREETATVLERGRRKAAEEARSALRDIASSQKHRAAEGVGGIAESLHAMARSLNEEHREVTARYADFAAERLERLAAQLREGDVDEIMSATEDFARRQPLLFLGGAAAAGFLLARFLRGVSTVEGQEQPVGTGPEEEMEETDYGFAAPPGEAPASAPQEEQPPS